MSDIETTDVPESIRWWVEHIVIHELRKNTPFVFIPNVAFSRQHNLGLNMVHAGISLKTYAKEILREKGYDEDCVYMNDYGHLVFTPFKSND